MLPVIVGPVVFMGGMWGYPGGPIMDMPCLESMYRFPVCGTQENQSGDAWLQPVVFTPGNVKPRLTS